MYDLRYGVPENRWFDRSESGSGADFSDGLVKWKLFGRQANTLFEKDFQMLGTMG